jgi:aspartyl-tRNA(Asn)/glutamyl-tRNA(Gln) amidotransferase subunit A
MSAPERALPFLTLTEAAEAIASREVSSLEVVRACIERIERLDPELHFFIWWEPEEALAAARAADARLAAGSAVGPLHGVPLAHKDMFYVAGKRSTCGSELRRSFRPTYTSTVMERLAGAGAINLGGLAMVEFAMGPHGYNAHLEQCRNPWNLEYIPCGSSSGSGVAVGARAVYGALGSDTGGSIRCPAAVAGVVGICPTYSRVSRYGAMPMSTSLECVGPLARTVRDCARMLRVIAGADGRDTSASDEPVPDWESTLGEDLRGVRVGVPDGYFYDGVADEIRATLAASLDVLRALGAEVVDVKVPPSIYEVAELHPVVMKAEGAANHSRWMRDRGAEYSDQVRHRLQAGFFIPATDYIQALKARGQLLAEFADAVFTHVDVLHTPLLPMAVPRISETMPSSGPAYLDMVVSLTRNTKIVNYLGLPAMSVPCGFSASGLPIGFQLIARPFAEERLFRVGHAYERATRWHALTPAGLEDRPA